MRQDIKDTTEHTKSLERQFTKYRTGVVQLSILEEEKRDIEQALANKNKEIQDVRSELPEEIISLYEQQMVIWKLQGDKYEEN